jgi:hypothetical protein
MGHQRQHHQLVRIADLSSMTRSSLITVSSMVVLNRIPCNAPRTHNLLIPGLSPCPSASALAMENKKLPLNIPHYLALHIQHNHRSKRHSLVGNRPTSIYCLV